MTWLSCPFRAQAQTWRAASRLGRNGALQMMQVRMVTLPSCLWPLSQEPLLICLSPSCPLSFPYSFLLLLIHSLLIHTEEDKWTHQEVELLDLPPTISLLFCARLGNLNFILKSVRNQCIYVFKKQNYLIKFYNFKKSVYLGGYIGTGRERWEGYKNIKTKNKRQKRKSTTEIQSWTSTNRKGWFWESLRR